MSKTPDTTSSDGPVLTTMKTVASVATEVYGFVAAHPGLVLTIVAAVAVVVIKVRRRKEHIATTGELVPPVTEPWKNLLAFSWREDTRPVLKNPRYAWVTSRVVLLATVVSAALLLWFNVLYGAPGIVILLLGFGYLGRRFQPVYKDRERAVGQMFDIASSKLKMVKGAELNKRAYVIISKFKNLVVPEQVIIMYPASVDAGNVAVQTAFESHFNSQAAVGTAWEYAWEPANNRVIITAQPPLPAVAPFPFPSIQDFEWNEFPLGIGVGNKPLTWEPNKVPHVLVAGVSGSGKSVSQRNILLHALQSDRWRLILIDPKRVELSMYKNGKNVLMYAVEDETMLEALEFALAQMAARYELMEDLGVASYLRLPDVPPALLIMVDEVTSLLKDTGDKEVDAIKRKCKSIVGKLAREGRAAGCHLVLATQRPDADVLGGDTRSTIEGRIAMGRLNQTASTMVLDNALATRTPSQPRGRGIWADGANYHTFQSYFFDEKDIKDGVEIAGLILDGTVSVDQVKAAMRPKKAASASGSTWRARLGGQVRERWAQLSERAQAGMDDNDDDDIPRTPPSASPGPRRTLTSLMPRASREQAEQVSREFESYLQEEDETVSVDLPLGPLTDEFILDDTELERLLGTDYSQEGLEERRPTRNPRPRPQRPVRPAQDDEEWL